MANNGIYFCPFCGYEPRLFKKVPKVKNIKGEVTSPFGGGKIETEINPPANPESYYDCKGCNNKYVDISSRNIESILFGIQIQEEVVASIIRYYGRITISRLVRNHRTGIARQVRSWYSFLNQKESRNKLFICLMYKNIRTYITCVKVIENGKEFYRAERMGVP